MSDIVKLRATWLTLLCTLIGGGATLVSCKDMLMASPSQVRALQVQADQNTARISTIEKAAAANAETLARIDERTKIMAERQGIR